MVFNKKKYPRSRKGQVFVTPAARRGAKLARATKKYGSDNVTIRGSPESIAMFGATHASADQRQRINRVTAGFRGRGDYRQVWDQYKRYIPRAIGAAAGGLSTRTLAGAAAGWNRGASLSKMVGWGDYEGVAGPSVNQIIGGGDAPMSVNMSEGDLTGDLFFNHREFVCCITARGPEFENRVFPINPGMSETFPYLAQLAANFTMYELQGLLFEYVPTSGDTGQGSNALGQVIMATDYDPDSAPFKSDREMLNYDYAQSTVPCRRAVHGVETARGHNPISMMYVRSGESTRDRVFTDLGTFQIATQGIPVAGELGQLWVTYRVRLSRAQLHTSLGRSIGFASAWGWIEAIASGTFRLTDSKNRQGDQHRTGYVVPPNATSNHGLNHPDNTLNMSIVAQPLTQPINGRVYNVQFRDLTRDTDVLIVCSHHISAVVSPVPIFVDLIQTSANVVQLQTTENKLLNSRLVGYGTASDTERARGYFDNIPLTDNTSSTVHVVIVRLKATEDICDIQFRITVDAGVSGASNMSTQVFCTEISSFSTEGHNAGNINVIQPIN